ncbi:MAG: sulfatase [Planctomycetes bacterium]|jgi:arylsulfatase A-like enzyme|nr:sulfatase [Planctomycetota bacterium]
MVRPLIVAGFALFVAFLPCCGGSRAPSDRPDVVLVVMDTTRADRCSVLGYGKPTTPNLERLAAEGALFTDAWSPSPWTGPAHASLFTGLRPENHGFLSGPRRDYLSEMPTLAGWFKAAGYRTACFSNSPFVSGEFGLDQGFEHFTREFLDPDRPYPYAAGTHRAALAWVRECRSRGENFFLFVNDIEPHSMYTPPEPFETSFMPPGIGIEQRRWGRTLPSLALVQHTLGAATLGQEQIEVLSRLYDGEVACLDREVGNLAEGLRESGLLDRSVFAVVADHGEQFGERGRLDHHGGLHQALLHVPMVIRYPPAFPPGTVVDDVVRLEDVPPTLLDLCDLPEPDDLDGESLLAATGGRVARAVYHPFNALVARLAASHPREVVTSGFTRRIQSVYDGRWHYILHEDGEEELYDLDADPSGSVDLSIEHREDISRLSNWLPIPQDLPVRGGAEPAR